MSLTPLLFSDWWEDLDRPHHLMDQHFGVAIHPEKLLTPNQIELFLQPRKRSHHPLHYYRPWADLMRHVEGGGTSTVHADKDKFHVVLDVQQFEPQEIDVKVVDKYVVVTANHEEKRDEHGWISRRFERKYLIPEKCDIDQVASKLSSDGVLTITAPRKDHPKLENERVVKIEHTGKPAVQAKPATKPAKESTDKEKEKEKEKKK